MEQKTTEEILEEHYDTSYASIKIAMEAYAKQQQEIAVEKALIKCSAKAITHSSQLAEQILSLKPEILKELKK